MIARRTRPGFALVAVLWALVILGGLSVHFHGVARADRLAAINARSEAQARWAARAGFAHALETLERRLAGFTPLGMAGARADTLLPAIDLVVDRVPTRAVILDHRARLNINTVPRLELRLFLAAAGVAAWQTDDLADAILADRGAGFFVTPGKLRDVEGMTPDVYRLLEPHVTAAGDGRINVNTASLPVLMTLPGMDLATAGRIIQRRARSPFANTYELFEAMAPEARRVAMAETQEFLAKIAFGPRAVAIVVEAGDPVAVAGAELRATIDLLGGAAFTVVAVAERPVRNRPRSPRSGP
jgi:type II secretory pathway component PulK